MRDRAITTHDEQWKVGPGFIETRHLELVSLNRVARASWQPQFRLEVAM